MIKLSERLIYDRITNASADTGTNNLRQNKVKPGRIKNISIVSVENITSAYTSLRIGVFDDGIFHPYFEEKNPVAGELYFTVDEIILREGLQLQAELTGCTAGDHLEMYILGFWSEEE